MMGPDDRQRRQDRHERKLLALGIPEPKCTDCFVDNVVVLVSVGADPPLIKCANCKTGYAPLSVGARKRKLARFAEAGYGDPRCALCGLDCLRLLELHHLAGKANSDFEVPLCRNCHQIQSDLQEDLSMNPDLRRRDDERDPHLKQAAMLEGLAIFLVALVIVLLAWAAWNRAAAQDLSNAYGPGYWHVITADVPR
jgi:hypothetical protein